MKRKFILAFLSLALLTGTVCILYSGKVQTDLAQNVVRLHILANSDSSEDQALKLAVRDRILSEGRNLFENSSSKEQTEQILRDNIVFLKDAANDEIIKNGYSYPVNIEIGEFDFPMKQYENYAFPAGKYEAVRIEIGEAKGHNWWCVMFPPLCFVDAAVSEELESVEVFKNNLSPDELDIITSDSGVDIRFKVVDLVQSSLYSIKTAFKK